MADANKKENIFSRIGRWLREMRSELKKVVWPGKTQMVKNTVTVALCTLAVGLCIWIFDLAAELVYSGILQLASVIWG